MLTSTEAASLAAVTPSTIKRWADQGLLPVVRTAGGHRRFERHAVERLLSRTTSDAGDDPAVGAWLHALIDGNRTGLDGRLLMAHSRLGSWAAVGDELCVVLVEMGRRWQSGQFTIVDEHRASEALSRALARMCDLLPVPADAPRCLLACAEGDEHTLGLSFAELCLREKGIMPIWLGRMTPLAEVIRMVTSRQVDMVALSASPASDDAAVLGRIAESIGAACREHRAGLVFGGSGAWPHQPSYGTRITSFAALRDHLDREAAS